MYHLRIELPAVVTRVVVGPNALRSIGQEILQLFARALPPSVFVLTDDRVGPLYYPLVRESLSRAGFACDHYEIPAGEAAKALSVAEQVYRAFVAANVSRDAVVLALGGGVVSDLAGFVAATWMRGIRFVICPTTLEADVDAAIGGKTGINIPGGKNLVGAFHHPLLVAIDPCCLQTLDSRDVYAGLAESVKHALISSSQFLLWHEEHAGRILELAPDVTGELIRQNIEIKSRIVTRDPTEQGQDRAMLNLGHTIGHAIEECCGYAMRHGECVSLGLVAACRLSRSLGLLEPSTVARVEDLLTRLRLPIVLAQAIETGAILATLRRDKKIRQGQTRFVLLDGIGNPVIRDDIDETSIVRAYESLLP